MANASALPEASSVEGLRVIGGADDGYAELLLLRDACAAPPRWSCRRSPRRSCRQGRGRSGSSEDFGTISLVPAMKKIGEKATSFRRSILAVVDPHSRSISPEATFCRRFAGVTGANPILISMPSSSVETSSTISRQRSIA